MQLTNSNHKYGLISIGFHWLMLVLIVAVYACIELRELYPKGSDPRETLKSWHFVLGLSVFCLVWLRLAARLLQESPVITPKPSNWMTITSKVTHGLLYGLMIGMPIGGWLILSAEGKTLLFNSIQLPALIGEDKALAELIEELHETIGVVGYYLIGMHTLAALFHHYYKKDNTLSRMLFK